MKLLIFIHSLGGGGAERVTANLANHWVGRGWEITVVTLASCSFDAYELHPDVQRISLNLANESSNIIIGLWRNLRRSMALRQVLRKIHPDIALGMMTAANVQLALATSGLSAVRAIGSERVHPPQVSLGVPWEWLRRHFYGRLAAVTALTCESADWLQSHTTTRLMPVIPNAVPWPLPEQAPKLMPTFFRAKQRRLLISVGRLDGQKGFDWLVTAFSILAERHTDWDLVILGEGELRGALERQVSASKLETRVFLPGRVGNVGDWYECADLYVMSSRFEGFPNTLVEALAYGLPAVSFDCDTGPRDIIRHEIDGLLVPVGDVTALTAALERLMGNADLRKRFANRAVEARERFSIDRIASMWETLFVKVMK
jgi:glycosyltransferase involved in cell wall biosynthesis